MAFIDTEFPDWVDTEGENNSHGEKARRLRAGASKENMFPVMHSRRETHLLLVVRDQPDHRDESCRLVDAPCCWPGGLFGVCRWEQWTREGTHVRKTGSGATRKTTRRDDRRIVRQALVDPTVTPSTIRADVGVAIVPQTISRHLAEANLKSNRSFRALPLTPEHRQMRLQ
ncbi:HTH_Tnp_Tc3_2 domain-containing protein [Trichonephila clavipes]|nr:HTH_Tnp_Tc3_2 domain-containing protein [Trichonephila clavipes]